ncbi:hypothetical protein KsCSTR_14140 [Candidatus Kuenenia stuttgartiensis]|uniref:Uncharacterized protein n=1 Tax=Kuenenia stuttgartiensis TaxID=174633 RepID=Q1Q183_KUEST|nr:hypothetical protein KsCSTR_14140 [Candidatus Kuenenia stuttgartiensis]CAJ73765.1 unknown protein [Candidatus Kuenenia stuttgartiensis]
MVPSTNIIGRFVIFSLCINLNLKRVLKKFYSLTFLFKRNDTFLILKILRIFRKATKFYSHFIKSFLLTKIKLQFK